MMIDIIKENQTSILIGVIVGLLVASFTIVITLMLDRYFYRKRKKQIKKVCVYHLDKLNERLNPTKEEDDKVFFSETKLNEIKTAWYVYEMLLANLDVFDSERFENTMIFFDNYSSNIEQIKSRSKPPSIYGYLKKSTFEKLKTYLNSALSELKK